MRRVRAGDGRTTAHEAGEDLVQDVLAVHGIRPGFNEGQLEKRGEGISISKQPSLADWLRRNICITFGICMHPIACTVNDGWGDKHERVPVKRV